MPAGQGSAGYIGLHPKDVLLETADATSMEKVLGESFQFPDVSTTDFATLNSQAKIEFMVVRNTSGIALLPGRVARWKAGKRYLEVDGYTTAESAEAAGVVSQYLPAAGAAANAIFCLARRGPHLVRSDLAGDEFTQFAEGDLLIAATAATSQATTAGRIRQHDMTVAATGATALNMVLNQIGRAMSANTTAQTNRQVRVALNILS